MTKDFVSYDRLIDAALRGVVRETLRHVTEKGLSGSHHLYFSFQTGFPGVELSDYLRAQYPDEMTIVFQHQFWGLEVEETFFAVTLSFNKVQEHLVIPFAALTQFADPSVRFGLQLQSTGTPPAGRLEKITSGEDAMAAEVISDTEAKVVNIDSFRKK